MRFLLDTSVVSALLRTAPDEAVMRWLASVDEEQLFLSVLTLGELEKGVEKRPPSRKRTSLRSGVPLPVVNGLIAATAVGHDSVVATRNIRDFERCRVPCLNPWDPRD